jgi:hypothetical protein
MPIDPTIFISLVGLICNYRQEVSGRKNEDKETFYQWLTNHQHGKMLELLRDNLILSKSVEDLIIDQAGKTHRSLETLVESLAVISSRLDGLSSIQAELLPNNQISNQAIEILRLAESTEASLFFIFGDLKEKNIVFLSGSQVFPYAFSEPRFLEGDIELLLQLGLIRVNSHSSSGDPQYAITRFGSQYAKQTNLQTDYQ